MRPEPEEDPWDFHIRYMEQVFGRRDPECVWCGETVYMALQNFWSGGTWTTNKDAEGPCSNDLETGTRCDASVDGEHSCFVEDREAWAS